MILVLAWATVLLAGQMLSLLLLLWPVDWLAIGMTKMKESSMELLK
jgi:hypothetical protein